jgi:hypothetical protein
VDSREPALVYGFIVETRFQTKESKLFVGTLNYDDCVQVNGRDSSHAMPMIGAHYDESNRELCVCFKSSGRGGTSWLKSLPSILHR